MSAFLGGAAKGASEMLSDQEGRAFQLKLQNAQIEAQVQAAEAQHKRNIMPGNASAMINEALGIKDGAEYTTPQASVMASLINAKNRAKGGAGNRDSITGSEANKALGAKYFKDEENVTRLGFQAAQARINKETGSAGLGSAYTELKSGLKNLEILERLRDEADGITKVKVKDPKTGEEREEERQDPLSLTGPGLGLLGRGLGKLTGGKVGGSNKKLEDEVEMIAPGVAKAAGHVGNLNEKEVLASVRGIGNARLVRGIAKDKINLLREKFVTKISEMEKQYPQLVRQGQNQGADTAIAGLGTNAPAAVKTDFEHMDPMQKIQFLYKVKEAYDATLKNKQTSR